jgi:alkyl sulfatase BDS1-like metallo-beta-lactamase superfamily hydrolase
MNAADAEIVTIDNGAKVGADTKAYYELPVDSPQRASYDSKVIVEVADGVWTVGSSGIINIHAVRAPDGLVVYDTGDNPKDAQLFLSKIREVEADAPICAILYSHEHYVFGTQAILDAEAERGNTDIKIIGPSTLNAEIAATGGVSSIHPEVAPTLIGRTVQQFNLYLPSEGPDAGFKNTIVPDQTGFVPVNTPVTEGQSMNVCGLDMIFYTEGISTDTNNQLLAWLPSRGIAMNNIIWGWYPNIYSIRGGRYRSPEDWMQAVVRLKELEPKILLSTHSTSMVGKEAIRERPDAYYDGLSFVLDQTLKGILLGLGPDELRYFVKLPPHLEQAPILIQNYGEIANMTPRIFVALFGQYGRNAANIHKLHPTEEAQRMVNALGGPERTAELVRGAHADGDYLWACQLADYLVTARGKQSDRQLKADCLRTMGYLTLSQNSRSWFLTEALELEGKTAVITTAPAVPSAVVAGPAEYVNNYRVRISADRAADTDAVLGLEIGDNTRVWLHLDRAIAKFIPDLADVPMDPEVVARMSPETWAEVFNNLLDPAAAIEDGKIEVVSGDSKRAAELFGLFDPIYDWENDPALQNLSKLLAPRSH